VVLFVNGLALAVIEFKNAADENATVWSAFQQLQIYQAQLPCFVYDGALGSAVPRRSLCWGSVTAWSQNGAVLLRRPIHALQGSLRRSCAGHPARARPTVRCALPV
jgi:hypothetical protein